MTLHLFSFNILLGCDSMKFIIRLIEEKDNQVIKKVLNECLDEFADYYETTDSELESLDKLSFIYNEPKTAYFIAEDEEGNIVGGCGISKIEGVENTCEFKLMFVDSSVRQSNAIEDLFSMCFSFAKKYYNSVYVEIPTNIEKATIFYENHGFKRIDEPIGDKEVKNNTVSYLLKFKTVSKFWEVMGELLLELLGVGLTFGCGLIAMLILPKDCVEELDAEALMMVGGLVLLFPCLLIGLIILLFKRKDRKK